MNLRYARRTWADRNRPRVLDVAPGLVHESGPVREGDWTPERVALMAHWSTDPVPSRSVVATMGALDAAGYDTVLVGTAQLAGPLGRTCAWAPGQPSLPPATSVLRRANAGHDFGSWAAVLAALPGVQAASRVLLVNDSVIGPLRPLAPALADFEHGPGRVWGLVGSCQHRPHLQTFFMGFRDAVLNQSVIREFWTDVRVESRKAKVVRYYELGLAEVLDGAGIEWRAMFTPVPGGAANPTLAGSRELLDRGMPFVKANAPGLDGAGLADTVREWIGDGAALRAPAALPRFQRWRFATDVEGLRGILPPRLGSVPLGPLRDSEIT